MIREFPNHSEVYLRTQEVGPMFIKDFFATKPTQIDPMYLCGTADALDPFCALDYRKFHNFLPFAYMRKQNFRGIVSC